jgi:hypothetical protein
MKLLFTYAFCLLNLSLFAQRNFIAGSVSLPNGQSVKGVVDYREWKINPSFILFKNLSGRMFKYTPKDILEFRVDENDEVYRKGFFRSDTVFLLSLVSGDMNLYSFRDKDDELHYFIKKENQRMVELIRSSRTRLHGYSANMNQTHTYQLKEYSDEYKQQLRALMSDYPALDTEINNLILNYNSILDLVKKYNQKKGELSYVKPKDKNSYSILTFGGFAQSNHIIFERYFGTVNKTSLTSFSPTVGLGFEWNILRTNKKGFVGIETAYQRNRVSYTTESRGSTNSFMIDIEGLRYSIYLKYILYKGAGVQPYAKAGVNATTYFTRSLVSNIEVNSKRYTNLNNLSKVEKSVFAALGVKARSFYFEARFEPGADINQQAGQDLYNHRLSLLAGFSWSFGKKK